MHGDQTPVPISQRRTTGRSRRESRGGPKFLTTGIQCERSLITRAKPRRGDQTPVAGSLHRALVCPAGEESSDESSEDEDEGSKMFTAPGIPRPRLECPQ